MSDGDTVLQKRVILLVDCVLVRLIGGLTEAVESVNLDTNIKAIVKRRGAPAASVGGVDIGTHGDGEVRSSNAETTSDVLAEDLASKVKSEEGVDAGGGVDLAGDGRSDALEGGVEAGAALADGDGLAVGKVELGADDGGDGALDVGDGNDNVEGNLGGDGDDLGNLELGEGVLEDVDVLGQVGGGDGGRGGNGHGEADVDAVSGEGRGGEAVLGRDGNVGVEAAVGATVGARDGEVGRANVGVVEVRVEGLCDGNLDLLGVAGAAGELPGLGLAADVDGGVLDKVLPLGGGPDGHAGDARGLVVADRGDLVRLAAGLAAAAGRVGDVDERVGVALVDPRPGLLGVGRVRGALEVDLERLAVAAVDRLDEVGEAVLVEQAEGRRGSDAHVGQKACVSC